MSICTLSKCKYFMKVYKSVCISLPNINHITIRQVSGKHGPIYTKNIKGWLRRGAGDHDYAANRKIT